MCVWGGGGACFKSIYKVGNVHSVLYLLYLYYSTIWNRLSHIVSKLCYFEKHSDPGRASSDPVKRMGPHDVTPADR